MSKSEVLYVKGRKKSNSGISFHRAWDDKELTDAYRNCTVLRNIEVAQRVAMSTNTSSPTCDTVSISKKEEKPLKVYKNEMVDEPPEMWGPGMPCRLIYKEDGLEYEAVIVEMVENDFCTVRYLGYENEEVVPIDSLMPSYGKAARAQQIKEAMSAEENYGNVTSNAEYSDRVHTPDNMDKEAPKKKKSSHKKKSHARNMNINGFEFPEIPPMPNLNMLSNHIGSSEMPMPPPPMAFSSSLHQLDSEDQAVSAMLLSWYMSGYYTGLYQGMKRARDGRRNQ